MYVAAITTQSEILISRCASEYSSVVHYSIRVSSKQVQKVLAHAEIFRWSPEVYTVTNDSTYQNAEAGAVNHLRAWLLVSDRQHLTALSIELDLLGGSEAVCTIIANYDLGTVLGRLSYADFCFSHQYAIVLQTTGIQATLISLTRPERHDIPNTKYQDKQGLAVSQNSKYFAILMRSEGQDIIHVFTTTEMGSIKSSPFSPWTYDAQGLKWCPNGDPLLCVWDSATFGSKVSFLTASGHHLRQLDLPPNGTGLDSISAGFQGLGVNTVDWLSFDGKAVLGVFNSSRQLYLWGQSGSQKVYCLDLSTPYGMANLSRFILQWSRCITRILLMVQRILSGRSHKMASTISRVILPHSSLTMCQCWLGLIRLA